MNGYCAKLASNLDAKVGLLTLSDPRQHTKCVFFNFHTFDFTAPLILTSLVLVSYKPVSYKQVSYRPVSYKPVSYRPVSYKPVSYKSVSYFLLCSTFMLLYDEVIHQYRFEDTPLIFGRSYTFDS